MASLVLILTAILALVPAVSSADLRFETSTPLCMSSVETANGECSVDGWHAVERAAPHVMKTLVFAVRHKNAQALDDTLKRVSQPNSPDYGKYLSLEELEQLTRNDEGISAIKNFLLENGVRENQIDETINGDFLVVRVPVRVAEDLLKTQFHVFEKINSNGQQVLRTPSFSLPETLRNHIDFVGETIQFPTLPTRIKKHGPVINNYVTPALLNEYYHIDSNLVKSQKSTQSLFESLGQNYSPDDLKLFQRRLGLDQSTIAKVIGPNYDEACERDPEACGEANLDVQYILAVASNAPTTFWSMEGDVEPFMDWVLDVANDTNPPLVHSISYGGIEDDPPTFQRFSQEIQKLGIRGVTVVVSSGDDGVANFPVRGNASACGFNPSFPASCPYVVAVGATQGPESGSHEIACSSSTNGIITSGGGFSTVFEQPSYQAEAVEQFFANSREEDLPPQEVFHRNGRAYPDVSLLGYNYIIVDDQRFSAESGTSASAPVFAGMIALINGELLANGKPPVGFFNPLLYELSKTHSNVFNDITEGDNHCGAGEPSENVCCQFGFSATRGFDPVTGLGSVHFASLKKRVLENSGVKESGIMGLPDLHFDLPLVEGDEEKQVHIDVHIDVRTE